MIDKVKNKNIRFEKKRLRSKKHLVITDTRPRLLIVRSNKYLYANVIDINNKVLASYSSISKDLEGKRLGNNIESAKKIGAGIAKKLKALKIDSVVFDRNGLLYHGKVKALADTCREAGIKF